MILLFLLLSSALAVEPIERPKAPEVVDGECKKTYPIREGQPLPSPLLSSPSVAACSGVVVPLSDYADLLAHEQWAKSLDAQFRIEVSSLEMDLEWYKKKLDEQAQPVPWIERPASQRWLGRIETIVIVGIVTAGLGATYHYSTGIGR